jgi:methylmalonyl-CoA mutase
MSGNKTKDRLFAEFPEISTLEWEEKIMQDLKGGDYEKKLVWKTIDGLKLNPYYRSEHLTDLEHIRSLPGEYPFLRGTSPSGYDWEIRQDIYPSNIKEASQLAKDAAAKGANAIGLNVSAVKKPADLKSLLAGIDLDATSLHFHGANDYLLFIDLLTGEIKNRKEAPSKFSGSLEVDPMSFCLLHGHFNKSKETSFDLAADILRKAAAFLPALKTMTINGHYVRNAGASIVQELAYGLASGNEYLAELTDRGVSIDDIASRMVFRFGIGSNYFLEIAKLRATRLLWAKIVEQYKPEKPGSAAMVIHATTSTWNKSIYDPYVNILRTTTETMAAAIGGANAITVLPFDSTYKKADEFSERIARNQQVIIKEEAYLSKVADIAGGSYYIENLTHAIAEAAWKLFQSVEEKGGITAVIKDGSVYAEIEKTCLQRDMDIATRKTLILGTNQHPNQQESMLGKIQPVTKPTDLTTKLKCYRGALAFEAIRLATEDHVLKGNKKPVVFLFTIGNLTMRKARAMFSSSFFGCAGYSIIENSGSNSVEEGVESAIKANADIVVICSSDEEYAELLPKASKLLKEKNNKIKVVVAGYPTAIIDQLKSAGADDFIHLRSNVLETLQKYNQLLGI